MLDNQRTENFVEHLAQGLSIAEASRKCKFTSSYGSRLLKQQAVQDRLKELKARVFQAVNFWHVTEPIPSGDQILFEIMRVYKTAQRDQDKLKALELLGRYRALFTEKVETTVMPSRIVVEDEDGHALTVIDGDQGQAASQAA